ncbi:MAG: EamA family transporter [Candidatus Methanomethylophilaceae archaeon]|nr:EamA family transporter [Candidatus Methanomethylophilaceae archaeon]
MTDYSAHLGVIAALSAGIIWGFLGFFVRAANDIGIIPFQLTCLRYIMITAIVGVYILIKDRNMFRVDRRTAIILLIMGIIGTIVNSVTYLHSMTLISLSLASVLQYVAPFFVILISIPILNEKLTRTKAVAVVVAFAGCVLCTGVLTDAGTMNILGIALGTISGICFSVYTVGSKMISGSGYSVATVLFYTSLICCVGLAPFSDLPDTFGIMGTSMDALLIVIGMGLFVTLLPFVLFNYSLTKIEAGKASILTYAEPLAATIIGLMLYGEAVTVGSVIGMAMIFAALVVVNRKEIPSSV